jgi:hypothetical protein
MCHPAHAFHVPENATAHWGAVRRDPYPYYRIVLTPMLGRAAVLAVELVLRRAPRDPLWAGIGQRREERL